jgi:hypothetical protein
MNASIGHLINHAQAISVQAQTPPASGVVAQNPNIIALDVIRQVMQTMASSIDSLINQQFPIRTASGNPPAPSSIGEIITAKVLSNTLLQPSTTSSTSPKLTAANLPTTINSTTINTAATSTTANVAQNTSQYQVLISTPQQNYTLASAIPLVVGSTLQLKTTDNGLAVVLNTNADNLKKAATQQPPIPNNTSLKKTAQHTNLAGTNTNNIKSTPPPLTQAQQNTKIINQGMRQALPLQQPLNSLITSLQKTVLSEQQQLPKPLLDNIRLLFRQFQTANTLQQAPQLKNAIKNSGLFFEAKLADQLKPEQQNTKSAARNINSDVKALIQRLYQLVDQQTGIKKTASEVTGSEPALLYTAKPIPLMTAQATPAASTEKNLDIALRQLSQQLLSTIARTQLNQLETLAHRTPSTDNPNPTNQWALEIPIINGSHIDNLKLHIQEEKIEQDESNSKDKNSKQWNVMLDFDLHHLGKMSVQLKIKQKIANAIIWSQLETTHKEVNKQVASLQKGLEKVGVNVKTVDCRLGSPPAKEKTHLQQLVDVKT